MTRDEELPYGPGHPSYVAPLANEHLVELLRGREFDKLIPPPHKPEKGNPMPGDPVKGRARARYPEPSYEDQQAFLLNLKRHTAAHILNHPRCPCPVCKGNRKRANTTKEPAP